MNAMPANAFDLLLVDASIATMVPGGAPYGAIRDGAIGIVGDTIAWVGTRRSLPSGHRAKRTLECGGAWLTPGLVDCHTHLVYAGNRVAEFERRLHGASYADIARDGGGIAATMRATRDASDTELAAESRPRMAALADEGVTTIEVKSGYGFATAPELKQLRVARSLGAEFGVTTRTTLLAAHALPPEFAGRADAFVAYVCDDMIPAAARAGLADAVDAYCEAIAFTPAQTRRVFAAAHAHGLPVKLHADQLSDSGGAAIAAECGALSADHLEFTNDAGVHAMARAGTVAVLLPGAYYTLRETRLPPVAALRGAGVRMAVATDCNPGTSPATSLLLMLNMACTIFRLTPEEALLGATVHAARALGLSDRGAIAPGLRADLAGWSIAEPAELAYRIGGAIPTLILRGGFRRERPMKPLWTLHEGDSPLIVDVPHAGTFVPTDIAVRLSPAAQPMPDTDWHVEKLYAFAPDAGATLLYATHSRYVVDLNRDPSGVALYAGADNTEVCPTRTFASEPIYRDGAAPDAAEVAARVAEYFDPYHAMLAAQIERVRARHGFAVVLDGHSIRSEVPRFFAGTLPDLNLGTANGRSAAPSLQARATAVLADAAGFTHVVNGRFTGGWITRSHGRPDAGVHVLQLEMAERCYMDEAPPYPWNPAKAAALVAVLRALVAALSDARRPQ